MERPAKRLRVGGTSRLAAAENEDELVLRPEEVNQRRDPGYQAHMRTAWLKSRFESIFEKYGNPDLGSDEIDLRTGEVITDNGHIQTMGDRKVEDAVEALADDQDALILRGNGPKPPRDPSFLGIVPGISQARRLLPPGPIPPAFPASISRDPFGPRDPKWQVPELPQLSLGNGWDEFLTHMPTRRVALKRPLALENGDQTNGEEEDDVLLGLSLETRNVTPKNGARSAGSTPKSTTLRQQRQSPGSSRLKRRASLTKARKESTAQSVKNLQTQVTTAKDQSMEAVAAPEKRLTHSGGPDSRTQDEATGGKELVAIKSKRERMKQTPAAFKKPTNQTLRVELSRNIETKHEYQLLVLEDTTPLSDAMAGDAEQDGTLCRDDGAPAPKGSNASDATSLQQKENKSPTQPSRSPKEADEAALSCPDASTPNDVAEGDPTLRHKPVKSRKGKKVTKTPNFSDSYARNIVDPAYEFSDEDASSVLLPKSQKRGEQSASQDKRRPRPSARKSESQANNDPLRTSSANSLGLALSRRDSLAQNGNSDKENAPLAQEPAVKTKQTRKKKAPAATDKADDCTTPRPMTDDLVPDSPEIEESPEAQLYLEEVIAQERALAAEKGLTLTYVHTSDTSPASIGTTGAAALLSSPSPVLETGNASALGSPGKGLDIQPSEENGEKGAPEEADSSGSIGPLQSTETDLTPAHGKSSAQNKTPTAGCLEALEQSGMSSPTRRTRSVRRTYSTRTKKTRGVPVTPVKQSPPKSRGSAIVSSHKNLASGGASNKKPPSHAKTSLLSLISSDDEDELSLGPEAFTPSSRRGFLNASAILAPSPSAVRKSTLKTSLANSSHTKRRTPQRRPRCFHPYSSPAKGRSNKQALESARGTGADSPGTPIRRMIGPELSEELFPTPGGTMRRCGEAGFRCDRDFCMSCE